jgi:hypothetical protein
MARKMGRFREERTFAGPRANEEVWSTTDGWFRGA